MSIEEVNELGKYKKIEKIPEGMFKTKMSSKGQAKKSMEEIEKQDREMDINTLLSMINSKKEEIDKLTKNNSAYKIKIDELTIEKENISSELPLIEKEFGKENKTYKNNFIKLGQIRTSIDNLNNSIKKNNKIIPHFKNEINHYRAYTAVERWQ